LRSTGGIALEFQDELGFVVEVAFAGWIFLNFTPYVEQIDPGLDTGKMTDEEMSIGSECNLCSPDVESRENRLIRL
jgi:hypothetical protein